MVRESALLDMTLNEETYCGLLAIASVAVYQAVTIRSPHAGFFLAPAMQKLNVGWPSTRELLFARASSIESVVD